MKNNLSVTVAFIVLTSQGLRAEPIELDDVTAKRCFTVLEKAFAAPDFWPSMHAAEALTLAGSGDRVVRGLVARLDTEKDDQRRCGLARELVRAGDRRHVRIMLDILAGEDTHGHVHAAESLYKVYELGDGRELRGAFQQTENGVLRLMAAAALARSGNPTAMAFLRRTVETGDGSESRLAAWVLGRIGDKADIAAIRKREESATDPLERCFFQHSLAALGDSRGTEQLLANLQSDDAAARTYAAVFAGEIGIDESKDQLVKLLDDKEVDVRVRAAQALLVLAGKRTGSDSKNSQLVFQATKKNPRYTEGSIVELNNGELLCAVTEFFDSDSDFAKAHIVAKRSKDGGATWGASRILQERTGKLNVMSVTMRRLRDDTIAMFFLQKNAFDDLRVYVRLSNDEAQSFGEPILVTDVPGYHVMNNDRVTQLSSGRLVVPVASTPHVKTVNHFTSRCWLSDDGGKTWRQGQGTLDQPQRGAMEPEVIELLDGRLMMIARTQLGYIASSISKDGGDTWSEGKPLGNLKGPEAPATIRRIPSTGDLLLVWNNVFIAGEGHGGRRTPLSAAISQDDGKTWQITRHLETDKNRSYSYPSILFSHGKVHLSYWDESSRRYSTRYRALPVSWFYGAGD